MKKLPNSTKNPNVPDGNIIIAEMENDGVLGTWYASGTDVFFVSSKPGILPMKVTYPEVMLATGISVTQISRKIMRDYYGEDC